MKEVINKYNFIQIDAPAGRGKSEVFKQEPDIKIIPPWNNLQAFLERDGIDSITLKNFLGEIIDENGKIQKTRFSNI